LVSAVFTAPLGLARTVNLAFAIAASTLAPLLLLGVWWRRLTVPGAFAGLLVGGGLATAATAVTVVLRPDPGWLATVLSQPAAWCIPAAFAATITVSLLTQDRVPPGTSKTMARLHTPEGVELKSLR